MYYPPKPDFPDGCRFDLSVALIRENRPIKRLSRNIAYITGPLAGYFTHLFPEFRDKVIVRHRDGYAMSAAVLTDTAIRRVADEAAASGVTFSYGDIAISMPPETLKLLSRWAWDEKDTLGHGKTLPPGTTATKRGRYLRLEVPPDGAPRSVTASGLLVFDTGDDADDYVRYLKTRRHLPCLPRWSQRRHSLSAPGIKAILFDPDLFYGGLGIDVKAAESLPIPVQDRARAILPSAADLSRSDASRCQTLVIGAFSRRGAAILPPDIDGDLFPDLVAADSSETFVIA